MTTTFILVDFENVQPASLAPLANGPYKVKVFVGASQAKGRVSFEFTHSMQLLGDRAEYVTITRNGPNALDMHIAYYIGSLAARDPTATFCVISKDSDFDPLIEFLALRGITCKRVKSLAEFTARAAPPKPPKPVAAKKAVAAPRAPKPVPVKKPETMDLAPFIKILKSMTGKPATRKKLAQTLAAYFKHHGGARSDKAIQDAINELLHRGLIAEQGSKIAYTLG